MYYDSAKRQLRQVWAMILREDSNNTEDTIDMEKITQEC